MIREKEILDILETIGVVLNKIFGTGLKEKILITFIQIIHLSRAGLLQWKNMLKLKEKDLVTFLKNGFAQIGEFRKKTYIR